MNIKIVILFILFIGTSFQLKGQSALGHYKKMADELYDEGNYSSAINLYQRLLYFDNDESSKTIYLPLARAYTAIGNYEAAAVNYNNAYNAQQVDTLKYSIIFENAVNYILAGDTSLAYSELLNIPETNINERVSNKLHLLMGTLDYKSRRYSGAKKHFLAISGLDTNAKSAIETFFKKTKKIDRRYNPLMVEWMSILPGLGQLWCGYYKESANAFLLTGAFALIFIDVNLKYRALDGFLAVYPWLNRYYKGGIQKSYRLAETKREAEKNKLYNKFLKIIPPIN